jgi:small ligand-binding sensory domain FIST
MMRAVAVSSVAATTADALAELAHRLAARHVRLPLRANHTAMVFVTNDHARAWGALQAALDDLLGTAPRLVMASERVFHDQRVEEGARGIVILVLEGCHARVATAAASDVGGHIAASLLSDGVSATSAIVGIGGSVQRGFDFLHAFDEARVDVVGGVTEAGAVGAVDNGQPLSGATPEHTVAALLLQDVRVVPAFSLAAVPVGPVRTVSTMADRMMLTVDGRKAQDVLRDDVPRELLQNVHPPQAFVSFEATDGPPVLREVLGVDVQTGGVAVPMRLRVGARCRFAACVPSLADADLKEMLSTLHASLNEPPLALLVFAAGMRNAAFFGGRLWDVTRVLTTFGPSVPVVGISTRREVATHGQTHLTSTSLTVAAVLRTHP